MGESEGRIFGGQRASQCISRHRMKIWNEEVGKREKEFREKVNTEDRDL